MWTLRPTCITPTISSRTSRMLARVARIFPVSPPTLQGGTTMPKPPPIGQEFVISIAIPGLVASKAELDAFETIKHDCNALAAKYNARVVETRLQKHST